MTNQELYGVSLEGYAKALGTTVEALIEQKKREIALLEKRYLELVDRRDEEGMVELARAVSEKLHQKREMLKRFERKWR